MDTTHFLMTLRTLNFIWVFQHTTLNRWLVNSTINSWYLAVLRQSTLYPLKGGLFYKLRALSASKKWFRLCTMEFSLFEFIQEGVYSWIGYDSQITFWRTGGQCIIHASGESCIEELLFIVENKHISKGNWYMHCIHMMRTKIYFLFENRIRTKICGGWALGLCIT